MNPLPPAPGAQATTPLTSTSPPCLPGRRNWLAAATSGLAAVVLSALAPGVRAHDYRAGKLRVDHPYALPTTAGIANAAVFFRGIHNRGDKDDLLIGGSTDRAARIEIHETVMDGDVARMREVDGIPLPAGDKVSLRHGQRYHVMLLDLKTPLTDGERFDLTLRFAHSGETTVKVWVQQPRQRRGERQDSGGDGGHSHRH